MQPPKYLHYTKNELIPPILILPSPGWILADQKLNTTVDEKVINKIEHGTHGYDPYASKEMQTIFFARGPAFKRGVTMEPFESVNVYPLLAHLLGIKPKPNNGSLSVFKHVLKEWNPSFMIDENEGAVSSKSNLFFGIIIVIGVVAVVGYVLTQSASSKNTFRVKKNV